MTSQQFLKATEQLKLLSEYVDTAITGKGKSDKIDTVNRYIENVSKLVLQNYIESSFVLLYKEDGREYVDIWSNRQNAMYFIGSYGNYINIDWNRFQQKFKNIFDFSRYKQNENTNFLTFCDE